MFQHPQKPHLGRGMRGCDRGASSTWSRAASRRGLRVHECFVIWAAHSPAASLQLDSTSLSGPGLSSSLSSVPLLSLISCPAPWCFGETRLLLHGRPTAHDAAPLATQWGKAALGRTKPGLIMKCHSRGEAGRLTRLGFQKSAPDKAPAQMPVC